MTIHRYLLEYLLENVFQGNQSSCAKELGMSYNDFRKFRKRMAEGSFSSRIAESILTFCWRDGIEMKDFFEKYSQSRLGDKVLPLSRTILIWKGEVQDKNVVYSPSWDGG